MISKKFQSDYIEFSTGGSSGTAIPSRFRTSSERHPAGIFLEILGGPQIHGQQKTESLRDSVL